MSSRTKGVIKKLRILTGISINSTSPKEAVLSNSDYGNGNRVVNHPKLKQAKIVFSGKNNILYCESPDITLRNCKISFSGSNSLVYLSAHSGKRPYQVNIYTQSQSTLFIGSDVNFHKSTKHHTDISVSEGRHIIIGSGCLFSMNIWIRTSDGHAVYDIASKKRLNVGKSVLIGDHVWIGQDVSILKGSVIGSGSIVGAGSVVTGKHLPSNSSCGGVPAKVIKEGVFFTKPNINGYTTSQLKSLEEVDTDEWIYNKDTTTLSFESIDKALSEAKTSDCKLEYTKKHLAGYPAKNRFFIPQYH